MNRPAPERVFACLAIVVGFLTGIYYIAWLAGRIVGG